MKVTQKKADGNKITLAAVASEKDVAKALQMAAEGFARSMGLVPDGKQTVEQAIEEKLGVKDLDSIIMENAIQLIVPMALDKKNMMPSYMPEVKAEKPLRRGEEFKFDLEVTLKPEYELSSYDPVQIEVVPFAIAEEDVDAEIERMSGSYTAYVKDADADPNHELAPGDFIKLQMVATQNGEELAGLTSEGRTYAVGAGYMPDSFDEQIVGMKVGEEKEFDFEGPSLDPNSKGDVDIVHAKIKVLELQREKKPEITDEWVKVHAPMFNSVEEMRANVRKSIEARARESYDTYLRQAVAVKLSERFEGKIDDEIYEAMMMQIRSNIMRDLEQQGQTWEQFVDENGGEQQITIMLMMQAREVIVQGFALDAVFRHFKLTVDANDVEAVCHTINPNADPKMMREQAEQAGQGFALREVAERFKANQYALDNAEITYIEEQG